MAKKEIPQIDSNKLSQSILSAIIDENEKDVWNRVETVKTKVSTGSLSLDAEISLTQGIHRFCGPAGAGKTSEAAEVARNFLAKYPKSKVLWIKAEGRLSENIQNRSGVKFVSVEKDWDYGTAFLLECNTFETLTQIIDSLVTTFAENGERLLIVLDSIDGLKLKLNDKSELGKERTAGVPLLLKRYLQKSYFSIEKSGTVIILISQVSASPRQDDYAPPSITSGAGGNAALHWANYILEFAGRFWGDNILVDPKAKFDSVKNPIIGHVSKLTIKKSDKENENKRVEYPIKHGRGDGKSIWFEYEIIPFLIKWNFIEQAGAWYEFSPEIIKDVQEKIKFEMKPKHQGFNNLLEYLENNPTLMNYLYGRVHLVESK